MATGDMKNNIKQLQSELKAVTFSQNIDVEGLVSGSPKAYLGIYHYLFTTYSTKLNKDISNSNNELYGKSDMRFMEAVYKILRDMFDYKPHIHREQFFSPGFAEHKVIMATDILRLVRGRYKPPKSAAFKVAATRREPKVSAPEKVLQEPHERPRKIASKSVSNVAGAIVLPCKTSSTSGGFKIPKSAIQSYRVSNEGPQYGKSQKGRQRHGQDDDDDVDVVDISASTPDHSIHEPFPLSSSRNDNEAVDAKIRRKVVDLVSPALLKINEAIGKLDISVKSLEKREPRVISEAPTTQALTTGLTKQMNDVMFKVDTLTSRVVLIENRLMMVEAKLNGEENYHKGFNSSYSQHTMKKPPINPALNTRKQVITDTNGNTKPTQNTTCERDEVRASSNRNKENSHRDNVGSGIDSDVEVIVIPEDGKEAEPQSSKMSFMKTLVNTNDSETTLVTDASAAETPGDTIGSKQSNQASAGKDSELSHASSSFQRKATTLPFDDMFSPIRPYTDLSLLSRVQDESAISIPCATYEANGSEDRRASTPTQFSLDNSTLDRVTRINQMMAETNQLFQ